MNARTSVWRLGALAIVGVTILATQLVGQGGPGRGGPGMGRGRGPAWARQGGGGPDSQFVADRDVFHFLLQNRDQIRRDVKRTPTGVETVTESDKPEIVTKIQEHVAAMAKRVESRQPIHLRDPLFAEVFKHADKIKFTYEKTEHGVRVVETSDDPYVTKLIQAHADVVSLFLKNGFDEAHRNHEVPGQAPSNVALADQSGQADEGPAPVCPRCCPLRAGAACGKACPLGAKCPLQNGCPLGAACPQAKNCPAGADCPLAKPAKAADSK